MTMVAAVTIGVLGGLLSGCLMCRVSPVGYLKKEWKFYLLMWLTFVVVGEAARWVL